MSEICRGGGDQTALSAADWLCLAAAPTFAAMALLTGVLGGQKPMLCSAMHGASPLSGMVPMYLLMSAFHSAPWVALISRRRSRGLRAVILLGLKSVLEIGKEAPGPNDVKLDGSEERRGNLSRKNATPQEMTPNG